MKRTNLFACLLAIIFCVGMMSCTKEKGCTDANSPKYNADAEKDDGTCESTGDVFEGTWNITETVNFDPSIQEVFSAEITRVDDNTITITPETRTSTPFYSAEVLEVDAEWQAKTIAGTSNNNSIATSIEGDIDTENKFLVQYEVIGFIGVDTIYWNISR